MKLGEEVGHLILIQGGQGERTFVREKAKIPELKTCAPAPLPIFFHISLFFPPVIFKRAIFIFRIKFQMYYQYFFSHFVNVFYLCDYFCTNEILTRIAFRFTNLGRMDIFSAFSLLSKIGNSVLKVSQLFAKIIL